MKYTYVIVGAGNAGRTAAETLVGRKIRESILLLDAEPWLPYKRTQVSKKASEEFPADAFSVNGESWYEEHGIRLISGCTVTSLDVRKRTLASSAGTFEWEKLLLAVGGVTSHPTLTFPGRSWTELRTKDDARRFRRSVGGHDRVAVVGSGVLGVEAAWQARRMDREVVLVGRSSRLMEHYLDPPCAAELEEAATAAGIELIRDCTVSGIRETDSGIVLDTDRKPLEAGYAVVTIGSSPLLGLAEAAGIRTGRGIQVDEYLRTSVPGIWAAGDCAEHPDGTITGLWHSAEHQGQLAALSMTGRPEANDNPPYRLKCEVFGGLWFSAGPVNAPVTDDCPEAEDWRDGPVLWRPRFRSGGIVSLAGSAPMGMEKARVKAVQALLMETADRDTCRKVLTPRPDSRV